MRPGALFFSARGGERLLEEGGHLPALLRLLIRGGTIIDGTPEDASHHSRNLCVFAEGEVDRSPTGSGVSARLAVLHARGLVGVGHEIAVESILGRDSLFHGRVVRSERWLRILMVALVARYLVIYLI